MVEHIFFSHFFILFYIFLIPEMELHLNLHCHGLKAATSMLILHKERVPTAFCKLLQAARYLPHTTLTIFSWTDSSTPHVSPLGC